MDTARFWCRISVVEADGSESSTIWIRREGVPDLSTVDVVARRVLGATRDGKRVIVAEVHPDLADLLKLVGLSVEMQWEPECGEQALGIHDVEEEGHLGDPSV